MTFWPGTHGLMSWTPWLTWLTTTTTLNQTTTAWKHFPQTATTTSLMLCTSRQTAINQMKTQRCTARKNTGPRPSAHTYACTHTCTPLHPLFAHIRTHTHTHTHTQTHTPTATRTSTTHYIDKHVKSESTPAPIPTCTLALAVRTPWLHKSGSDSMQVPSACTAIGPTRTGVPAFG